MTSLRNFYNDNFPIIMICGVVLAVVSGILDYSLGPIFSGYANFSW